MWNTEITFFPPSHSPDAALPLHPTTWTVFILLSCSRDRCSLYFCRTTAYVAVTVHLQDARVCTLTSDCTAVAVSGGVLLVIIIHNSLSPYVFHSYSKVYPTYSDRCCLSWCFTAVGPGAGMAAAAMQWQSQVSPLILTVSCCLIHCSAFRTLAYIYKQLTLPVLLHPSLIPSCLSLRKWDEGLQ